METTVHYGARPPSSGKPYLLGARHPLDNQRARATVVLVTNERGGVGVATTLRRGGGGGDEAPGEHDGDCHQDVHDSPLHGNHLTFQSSCCFAPDGAEVRVL